MRYCNDGDAVTLMVSGVVPRHAVRPPKGSFHQMGFAPHDPMQAAENEANFSLGSMDSYTLRLPIDLVSANVAPASPASVYRA
jgi:hypothetical protein